MENDVKDRHNADYRYRLIGLILANLMPLGAFVPGLWILGTFYCLPLLVIEDVLRVQGYLVSNDGGVLIMPNNGAWLFAFVIWTVIGAYSGDWTLKMQNRKGFSNLSKLQVVNRVGGTLASICFSGYLLYELLSIAFRVTP